MNTLESKSDNNNTGAPCNTCSACCFPALPRHHGHVLGHPQTYFEFDEGYVPLDQEDVDALLAAGHTEILFEITTRDGKVHNIKEEGTPLVAYLGTRPYNDKLIKCAYVIGEPGNGRCGIYEDRPSACRRYVPGSRDCGACRTQSGQEPLPDKVIDQEHYKHHEELGHVKNRERV